MTIFTALLIAMVIDFIFGDPDRIWQKYTHPIVYIGRVITWFDIRLNRGALRREKGIVTIIILVLGGLIIGRLIRMIPDARILETIILTILIAHKSLIDHVKAVAVAMPTGLDAAREQLAKIVGRDVTSLDQSGIAVAAVESAAENFSDGVIAPIFWYLVLGLPGVIAYKIINTADSMIGHRSEQYERFGWAAAKLDDLVNWIPARVTAALMCLTARNQDAFHLAVDQAPLHASPNAGWPEAAMAGLLDIRLAGPRVYQGNLTDDLYINSQARSHLTADDIYDAIKVLNKTWSVLAAMLAVIVVLGLIF